MSRCLKTLSIKRPSSSRGVNFQVLISGHFLHLSPTSSNILRAGWRIVGGRAPLRLIWENSQHPQMPCVISTRNGWVLGQKEFRKVLPLSHNVQKQLDWDFMECANLTCVSVVRCQQKKQLPMQQNSQNIRWSENLAFYWRFGFFVGRTFGQEASDRKCQLAPKTADGILEAGTTWKKCRILATYLSPIRMWRRRERRAVRLHGKRSDSWEKTVKSEGSFSQRRLMVKEVGHLRWEL